CGGAFTSMFLNHYGSADFTPACDTLDMCYSTCNADKEECDIDFNMNLANICEATYGGFFYPGSDITDYVNCVSRIKQYSAAVVKFGTGSYNDAQEDVCSCCSETNVACGKKCCDAGQVCCDGGECCDSQDSCCLDKCCPAHQCCIDGKCT